MQSKRWSRINGSPLTRLTLRTPKGAVEAKMQHVCQTRWCCWGGILEKAELVGPGREGACNFHFLWCNMAAVPHNACGAFCCTGN